MKKNGVIKRETVFFIIIAIIIVTTILIILFNNNTQENNNNVNIENSKVGLEAEVDPNASPESNPSIAGVDNVEEINGQKVNTSNKLKQSKNVGEYRFTNIKMSREENGTVLTAIIVSNTKQKIAGRSAIINFLDNNGKLVSQMETYIPQIKPGEITPFRTETTADVTNAYDFEIVLK